MKILIIGGVAGGAGIATRARRLNENAEIIMFEKGNNVSFSNCCLPFYLSGIVEKSENLILMNPKKFNNNYNIDARTNSEVISIDPKNKKVKVKNNITKEIYEETYDKLAISTGATAILPQSIEGINNKNVFVVKTVDDIVNLKNYIENKNAKEIAVIGAGFIGVEVAENLIKAGKNVSLIQGTNQIMNPLDKDMASILHKELHDNNVNLLLNERLEKIEENNIKLASGKTVTADVVVMSIGVRPETTLAKECGIEIGKTGAIKVNKNYQTNFPDIYAVGDVIEVSHKLTGDKTIIGLAGPAHKQARIAANHMNGRIDKATGVIGTSSIHIFDLNVANTGLNEKTCIEKNINYDFTYTLTNDKVPVMPQKSPIFLKLIFEKPTGKILGAQAIGKGNTDKRIDVIASLISMNGTIEDLANLELCYSPYYSSAKDVLNIAGLVASNILSEEYKQVPVTKVRELVEKKAFIIDVREKNEWDNGHLINSINIPISEFRNRLNEIPKDKPVYIHCRSGQRSYNVVKALKNIGYENVYNISGSFLGICYNEFYDDLITGRQKIVTKYNFK